MRARDLLLCWVLSVWCGLSLHLPLPLPLSDEQKYAADAGWINGVNFGGWLVTEPSWMYDQFSAAAENDLIQQWRGNGGDQFAINTIKNHWAGYLPDTILDTIQQFGITHARIPVGYWIVDAPVNGNSMYQFGFNPEGYVTGGLNYLETMLTKLKKRGIRAIVDLHAVPGAGSSCQSYAGVMEGQSSQSFWLGTPPSGSHYSS
jgi:aryl-phospho-beta-D-glucosidase BglC (GH1 family)